LITINRPAIYGGETISGVREICHGNNSEYSGALFPGFFTESGYETLKKQLPDDRSCKVKGCYNNYCRFGGSVAIDTRV